MSALFLAEIAGTTRRSRTLSAIVIGTMMMTLAFSPYTIAQEKKEATQKEIDVKNAAKTQSPDTPLPKIDLSSRRGAGSTDAAYSN